MTTLGAFGLLHIIFDCCCSAQLTLRQLLSLSQLCMSTVAIIDACFNYNVVPSILAAVSIILCSLAAGLDTHLKHFAHRFPLYPSS